MTLKYCLNCKQNVNAEKHWSWFWFILFIPMTVGILSTVYILHYLLKRKKCPKCHGNQFSGARKD